MKSTRRFLVQLLCLGIIPVLLAGCSGGAGSSAATSSAGNKGGSSSSSKTGSVAVFSSDKPTSGNASGSASKASSKVSSSGGNGGSSPAKSSSTSGSSSKANSSTGSSGGSSTNSYLMDVESSTGGKLVVYPEYDARIEHDYTYAVSVTQGKTTKNLTCYNHCDNVAYSGRTVNGDTVRRFCEFAFAKAPVRVDITVKTDFSRYTVMPSGKNFLSEVHGNVISVYLEKPEYFLLKLDDKDDSILTVFADAPEVDAPKKGDPNVLYIDGWFEVKDSVKVLTISQSNYTVYLAPGSVLNSRIKVTGANVKIKGRGMILDPVSNIYDADASVYGTNRDYRYLLHIKGGGCTVEDVKMVDARDFNLVVSNSNTKVKNLKVLSSEMCTDGITQSSGDNNKYEHCYIYNGDNGIVITGGKNQYYNDITIGTICCGIFPQLGFGTGTFNNLYLFRADEGLMRNLYNSGGSDGSVARSFTVTLNNVSCVDCDHFPFIFMGGNMGTLPKTINFNNLAVPKATGSNQLGQGDGSTILFNNSPNYMATDNYTLNFNGLTVDGKAVTSASALKVSDERPNDKIVVTGNGAGNGVAATPNTKTVSCTAPGKIYIGNRQLFTKNPAVQKNGTWYVPAADVCQALTCSVPSGTTKINGADYLSLKALTDAKCTSSATYDAAAQAIRIAPPAKSDDLLSWGGNSVHSRWAELTCYNTHLVCKKEGSDTVYYNKDTLANAGANFQLTQQVQQYGKGTYTLTFDVKADVASTMYVYMGVNGKRISSKNVPLTTQWQPITMTFSVAQDSVHNAYLAFAAKADKAGIAIRNPKLVYGN